MSEPFSAAESVSRALDPRYIALSRLTGWITSAWLASASLMVAAVVTFRNGFSLPTMGLLAMVWIMANAALAWHFHRWPAISYRHTSYRFDERGMEIRRGVVWRRVVNVARSRVQHTDVSQGPLERQYGLGTLVIYTAGTDHAKVTLNGLAHEDALHIREQLLPIGDSDAV